MERSFWQLARVLLVVAVTLRGEGRRREGKIKVNAWTARRDKMVVVSGGSLYIPQSH